MFFILTYTSILYNATIHLLTQPLPKHEVFFSFAIVPNRLVQLKSPSIYFPRFDFHQDNGCDLTEDASAEEIQAALAKLKEVGFSGWIRRWDSAGWFIRLVLGKITGMKLRPVHLKATKCWSSTPQVHHIQQEINMDSAFLNDKIMFHHPFFFAAKLQFRYFFFVKVQVLGLQRWS